MLDNLMMTPVLLPLLAAVGLALATGPLGAFVIWRRMAYFGDATAHASILGVALAVAGLVPLYLAVFVVALIMALVVSALHDRGHSMDATLGVIAYAGLSLGLVAVSFTDQPDAELHDFLFGDILQVTVTDLWVIWGGALVVIAGLVWRWSALLTSTLNADLAVASGLKPRREQLVLTLALAVVVAVAIKVVGAMLIGAMLIIPAAAARGLSRSPEGMTIAAVLIGIVASVVGVLAAVGWSTPAGPSIVVAASAIFAITAVFTRRSR
ncbi:membrane protein [Marinosulfonomonas sp. PRT-SC04]|nr:membrane protein [Marinosulfonomonas sp. PRT-SC04]